MPKKPSGPDFPVILYDEHCNLCSATVMFILRHDIKGTFRFLGLRSKKRKVMFPLSVNESPFKSVILVEKGIKYFRSEAVLRIFRQLRFPVNLLYALVIIPPFVRDRLYNWVAKNRFRWFGQREEPLNPGGKWEDRFLEKGMKEKELVSGPE